MSLTYCGKICDTSVTKIQLNEERHQQVWDFVIHHVYQCIARRLDETRGEGRGIMEDPQHKFTLTAETTATLKFINYKTSGMYDFKCRVSQFI